MTTPPHDFTRPARLHPDHKSKLVRWLCQSNSLLAEMLTAMSAPVEIRFEDCVTDWPSNFQRDCSERALAYQVTLAECDSRSLLVIPNPLTQVMVNILLADQPTELPAERRLTPGEASVGEFLVSTILGSLMEGWLGETRLELRVGERVENPRRTKVFKSSEPIAVCRTLVKSAVGELAWTWLLTNDFLTQLFGSPEKMPTVVPDASTREILETLVKGMSTEVAIRLGIAQLTAPQIAKLQVGDLIVLNQRVNEPLCARIGDEPRFLGWPGLVGQRQAYVIESEVKGAARKVARAQRV